MINAIDIQPKEFINTHTNQLNGWIKRAVKTQTVVLIVATTIAILGVVLACLLKKSASDTCVFTCSYYFCKPIVNYPFITCIVIEIVAIVAFGIYKALLKAVKDYERELLILRDLQIAIDLAAQLPEKTERRVAGNESDTTNKKVESTPKAKLQEQIIQTLLTRCSR